MNTKYIDKVTVDALNKSIVDRMLLKKLSVRIYHEASLSLCPTVPMQHAYEVFEKDGTMVKDVNSNVDYENIEIRQSSNSCFSSNQEDIIYLGCFYNCWGHFITDALSKMWYLFSDEYLQNSKNKFKLAISFVDNIVQSCPSALVQLYGLLGVNEEDIIVISQSTRFRTIIIPDNSLFFYNGTRHFTRLYDETINNIVNAISPKIMGKYKKTDKIYLSRTHFTNGNADFGERGLELIFKRLGYHIIHPQEYSVEEQIAMFSSAKSLVSTAGSLGHNSVFCNPSTEVILLRKCFAIFDYQLVINQMRKLDVIYIDTHLTCFLNERPNNGPFFLYRNLNFVRFIRDRYNITVSENFSTQRYLKYARICMMRNDMKERYNAPTYYFIKLREELLQDSKKRKIFVSLTNILPKQVTRLISTIYFKFLR